MIRFYRNTTAKRFGHATLPARNYGRRLHLFWVGPLFVLYTPRAA